MESKETLSRYSNRLLYAEELSSLQLLNVFKPLREGDKCIYYYALMKEWLPAVVVEVLEVQSIVRISVNLADGQMIKLVQCDRSHLMKLDDDFKYVDDTKIKNIIDEEVDDNIADGPVADPDESYVVIEAVGNEKAEDDEDLVDVNCIDMDVEDEEEGN